MITKENMNQNNQTIQKLQIQFIALFILLSCISFFLISYIEKEAQESYLKQTTKTYQRAYNTIYSQYKELSDVVFTGLLKLADIQEKFQNLDRMDKVQKTLIREELYNKIIQRYKTLQAKHIRSVNFILPDHTLFLKVKNPAQSGKKISNKRHTLKYIQENKKPIDSFEIGKNGAGFRFAYPIIHKGKYLGIVSITFGPEAITSAIMKQYYVLSNFFINEKNFNKQLLKKKKHLYKVSHHEGFIFDKKVLKELKKVTRKDLKMMTPHKEFLKILLNNISNNKEATTFYDKKTKRLFTHIPLYHTITNEKDAVLTIRSKVDAINVFHQNYIVILSLVITLIAAILFLIYQHNIKLIKEKESLQENMEKDKQLLEQAKMAQMGEMLGNIAHQWRQPLSTISTAASGVKVNHEYGILTPEDIPKHMDIIIKNVDYLSQTIDTFRDFIKEDATVLEVVLQEKIDKTIEIISATLNQAHIKLINKIDYSEPYKVTVITGALPQVIINIINNSKDAIKENKVEDGWIVIDIEKNQDSIVVTIEDNGKGIPEQIISRIFDPYFTTKHQSVGTGLGLFMSHKIVTEHLKGKLYVKNTQYGAKFFIEIPLIRDKENKIELS